MLGKLLSWARRNSPWVFHINCGSCNGCDLELVAATTPHYDLERWGVVLVPSPRHADILLLTGPATEKSLKAARWVYDQIPEPKKVVAVGECPIFGCIYKGSPKIGLMKKHIPIDKFVEGCPPKPETIIKAVREVAGDF